MSGLLASLIVTGAVVMAPPQTSPPSSKQRSADATLSKALALMEERWILADRFDWSVEKRVLLDESRAPADDEARAKSIVALFARANDVHSTVSVGGRGFGHFEPVEAAVHERLKPLFERERARKGSPLAAIVDEGIGYLLVPGNGDSTPEEIARSAGRLRDAIESIEKRVTRGWIVDLRLNGGGNLTPMLLGLQPLLGNGVVGGTRDRADRLVHEWVLDGDALAWRDAQGDRVFAKLDGRHARDFATAPVVVLTGPLTRSSGQATALAFEGRARTTSVGEPTARGYTTALAPFALSDSLTLSLAVGFMADRTGAACRERVVPEHRVDGGDCFDVLEDDAKVRRAIEWLEVQAPRSARYDPLARGAEKIEHIDLVVTDERRNRELPLRVYLPPPAVGRAPTGAAKAVPAPVVLFSHGLGGASTNNPYLGEHWAARGYVAVFMQHPGSDESVWKDAPPLQRMKAMREAASLENYLLRADDVPAIIDQLAEWNAGKDHALSGRLDLEHVGMSGHSFGAVTTQAVSGQKQPAARGVRDLREPRIDAAIAMSPSAPQRGRADFMQRAFGEVRTPWLLMTGTDDGAPIGDQTPESRLLVYPALPPGDKYEVVLFEAEHSAFGQGPLPGDRAGRNPNHHRAILALSTAFWDAYLKGDPRAKAWLQSEGAERGPRAILEAKDRWQHK